MLGLLGYLLFILAASVGVAWLAEAPGRVTIAWHEWRIDTTAAFLVGLLAFTAAAAVLLWQLWGSIFAAPGRMRKRHRERMAMRGLEEATRALAALSAGDAQSARPHMAKAANYLNHAPIMALLEAQAAKLEKNEPGVRQALENMLEHKETKALAARSLAEYSAREGDYAKAQSFARQARETEPKNLQSCDMQFKIALQAQAWQQAEQVIESGRAARVLSRRLARHWRVLFRLTRAEAQLANKETEMAFILLGQARKAEPSFVPAAVAFAKLAARRGDKAQALSALEAAWKAAPHPLLTETLRELSAEFTAKGFSRAAAKLRAMHPQHPESKILSAYAAMYARQWPAARANLAALADQGEAMRALKAMADVEREGYGDAEAAAAWLMKMPQAAPEERWFCRECGHSPERWHALCASCNALDSLRWQQPEARQFSIV